MKPFAKQIKKDTEFLRGYLLLINSNNNNNNNNNNDIFLVFITNYKNFIH